MTALRHRSPFSLVILFAILLVLLAFLPLTERPTLEFRDSMTPNRIKEILLLLLSSIILTAAATSARVAIYFKNYPFYIVASFALWSLTSSLWSDSLLYSFGKSLELIILLYISTLIASISLHDSPARTAVFGISLPYAMILAIVILVVANIIIFGSPIHFTEGSEWRGPRLVVGTIHPLDAAHFFALTAIVLLSSRIPWPLRASAPFVAGIVLILADARGPMFAFGCALAAMMFKRCKTTQARVLYSISLLTVMIISVLSIYFLHIGYSDILPEDFESLNSRIPLWAFTLDIIYEHPLLGVGYFGSREHLIQFATWAGHAHNSYIEIMLTTGVIGFIILFLFVVYCAYMSFKSNGLMLIGVFIYVAVQSFLGFLLFSPRIPMFILLITVLMASSREKTRRGLAQPAGVLER